MNKKTIKTYAEKIVQYEKELDKAEDEEIQKKIQNKIESLTNQFMTLSKGDLSAVFELDYFVQNMLTK
ncbi:MAG: hypothetical protein RR246_07095 [Clostridia bacterium]